jgi:amino acid transporter
METAGPRKATAFQLVFMTYAVICSGAYGLEEMVSASGPGLSMLVLLVLPLLYAAPISLTCAELAARFPLEGGYYRWVRLAFGDFVGYTSAWLVWLSMFATNAAFAVLFGNYLKYFVPDLSETAHLLVAAALVWVAVALNYRGIHLVGWASVIFTVLIFVPFLVMTLLGLWQWSYSPLVPFAHPEKTVGVALFDGFLIAMWLYGGFEKLTVNAAEVQNPGRAFPLALGIAVPLCALSYIVPTFAALAANGDWQDWGESHYMTAAAKIGGPALGAAMALGGMVSNAGILMVTILGQSRLPLLLATDGLFPPVFKKTHARYGTPVASLLLTGILLTLLCRFRFAQLAAVYSLVQSLSYLLIYAALFKLRTRPDGAEAAAFRIPLSRAGVALLAAPSVVIVALVVRQGLFPDGTLNASQALLDLLLFASGPLTFLVFRLLFRQRTLATAARAAGLVMLALLLGGPAPAWAQKATTIRVGMDTRSRPWAYVPGLDYSKEDWSKAPLVTPAQLKRIEGIEIDILKAIAERMEVSYEIVPSAWERIEDDLLEKKFDMILNAWVPSDRTPAAIAASSPYYESGLLVAVRADSRGIASFKDLAGRRVGHFRDRVIDRSVQGLAASTLVPMDDSDQLFDLLASGKVDAVVEDAVYVRWRVALDRKFRTVGDRLNKMAYRIALRREDGKLLAEVEAAIKDFVSSSENDAIRKKWESPKAGGDGR